MSNKSGGIARVPAERGTSPARLHSRRSLCGARNAAPRTEPGRADQHGQVEQGGADPDLVVGQS